MTLSRRIQTVLGLGFVLVALAVWEAVGRSGLIDALVFRPASEVLAAFAANMVEQVYTVHAMTTARRFGIGFGLAIAVAVPSGVLLGNARRGADYVVPLVNFLYPIPVTALIPIAAGFLGRTDRMYAALVTLAAGIPIFLASLDATRRIEPTLLETAATLSASDRDTFLKVMLPAALPGIVTGIYVAAAIGVIVVIAAEMVVSSAGLGFLVLHAQRQLRIADMYAGIVAIAIFGYLVVTTVGWVGSRTIRWHRTSF